MFSTEKAEIYHYGLVGLLVFSQVFISPNRAWAQANNIQADPSFPTQVEVNPDSTIIRGGFPSGNNLFHRFSTFNIVNGQLVSFANDFVSENIFAQVLDEASFIDGTIESQGANLYLINPNGIVFGPNAELAVNGSFIATTADSVIFEDGVLSADSLPSDLVNINFSPQALQFTAAASQPTPFSIQVQADNLIADGSNTNLYLIGGGNFPNGILIDGGTINAPNRQVNIASFQGPATFYLDLFEDPLDTLEELVSQVDAEFADISLMNSSQINVRNAGGGSITTFSRNLSLSEASSFRAGTETAPTRELLSPGNIEIRATGEVLLTDGGFIENSLINATGTVGDITIRADAFTAVGTNPNSNNDLGTQFSSGVYDRLQGGVGQPGQIDIQLDSLFSLSEGAVVTTSNRGTGSPGRIFVSADVVNISGKSATITSEGSRQSSGLFGAIPEGGVGGFRSGFVIEISAREMHLVDGGIVVSDTFGTGSAGDILVNVSEILSLTGEGPDSDFRGSGIYSRVSTEGVGSGGEINVSAGILEVRNGATINATTTGVGNAGDIKITNTPVILVDGSGQLVDSATNQVAPSAIIADTTEESLGRGGDLIFQNIGQLSVENGGRISALTEGARRAGNLEIVDATGLIRVSGAGSRISFSSLSQDFIGGDAGTLAITAPRLEVLEGGEVSAQTLGTGKGGFMRITALDSIMVDGSGSTLLFDSRGAGNARGIDITTNTLTVQNQGEITVSGTGTGSPGDLNISANQIHLNQEGRLRAITLSGVGGNIFLDVGDRLFMTDGSQITASAEGPGDGGNIEILAPDGFVISRSLDENNDILASAIGGRGGRARATAIAVLGFQEFVGEPTPRSDFTASSVLNIDDGETIINEQEREFEEIPVELLDAQIARNCRLERPADQSEFVITGRGGIPATPAEMMNIGDPEVELVMSNGEADHSVQPSQESGSVGLDRNETNRVEEIDIVEPQGWVYNDNGDIVLVAYDPEVTPPSNTIPTVNCLSQNAIPHNLYQTPRE